MRSWAWGEMTVFHMGETQNQDVAGLGWQECWDILSLAALTTLLWPIWA